VNARTEEPKRVGPRDRFLARGHAVVPDVDDEQEPEHRAERAVDRGYVAESGKVERAQRHSVVGRVDEWGAQSAKRVYWPKGMPQFAVMRLSPESCPATDPEPRLQGLVLLPIFDRRLDGADASSQREVRGRLLSPTAVDERESSWGGVGW
jgi:hypothetical protein